MSKYLIALFVAAIALAGPVHAKGPKQINVPMDLEKRFGAPSAQGSKGFLVIESITNNRVQPEESGEKVTILPEFASTQIGSYTRSGREYVILLEGTNIDEFVRDVLTLGFNRAGYAVIPGDDSRAADAAHVEVDLTSLWMWVTPIEGKSRKTFHFRMEPVISSSTPALENIGAVELYDFRNGSRDTSWKSYNQTAMYTVKAKLDEISNKIRTGAQGNNGPTVSSAESLSDKLEGLKGLLDSGAITEEEYATARAKLLDDYSK
jgi:hypothetical protein